jgi:hypothetical protein
MGEPMQCTPHHPDIVMLYFAHVSYDRLTEPAYLEWANQFDDTFTIQKNGPCFKFYTGYGMKQSWKEFMPRLCNAKRILINEAFNQNGDVRVSQFNREFTWVSDFIEAIRSEYPSVEIWVTDCMPRRLEKWKRIREYCKYSMPDGLGVQVHFDIGRGIIPEFLTANAVFQFVKYQTLENQKLCRTAFSEVSVLPGTSDNISKLGQIYSAIDRLGQSLNLEWLCWWVAEDSCSYHWEKDRLLPCGLFTRDLIDRRLNP